MLLFLGALFLAAAAFVLAEIRTLPARQRRALVKSAATYGARPIPGLARRDGAVFRGRLFSQLVAWTGSIVLRLMPRTTRAMVEQRLLQAGLANRITADELLAAKGLFTVVAVVLGVLVGVAVGGAIGVLFAVGFGLVGLLAADVFVNRRIADRRERMEAALPDALDLLAVTVEAGLGFDGALAKLADYTEGPLAEEFALTLNEMRIGESRPEALKRLAARVDVPQVGSFVRAVVQADQLGMSIGATLRVQAADARVRRQLAAEEKAMKAPIKMIFPMVFLILPAMFIVIIGPFLLNANKYF
jgi:tight adherence protein C